MDRTLESLSPGCVRGVVMGMGDRDGFQAAFRVDLRVLSVYYLIQSGESRRIR